MNWPAGRAYDGRMPLLRIPSPAPRRAFLAGYTLAELVLVLALLGVLAALAGPPLGGMVRRQQVVSVRSAMEASLHHARELAIRSGRRVVVCPTKDHQRCQGTAHWSNGWMVVFAARRDTAQGTPAQVSAPMAPGITVVSSGGRRWVGFHPRGDAEGLNATLHVCRASDARDAWVVKVSSVGRIRSALADAKERDVCAGSAR